MTERQIAKESGYSPSVVHRKLTQGRTAGEIVRSGVERQKRMESAVEAPKGAKGSGKRKRGSTKPIDGAPNPNHPKSDEDYWNAQRRKEIALADLREIEVKQKRGELIPAAEVEVEWATVCTTIRDGMLSLPSKLSDRLAPITNPQEIGAILRSEIRAELTRISKDLDAAADSA
jgi:hypothetical protein